MHLFLLQNGLREPVLESENYWLKALSELFVFGLRMNFAAKLAANLTSKYMRVTHSVRRLDAPKIREQCTKIREDILQLNLRF